MTGLRIERGQGPLPGHLASSPAMLGDRLAGFYPCTHTLGTHPHLHGGAVGIEDGRLLKIGTPHAVCAAL